MDEIKLKAIPKIHLSTEADDVLEEMVKLTNEDFSSGRVKKSQLLSWIIIDFKKAQFQKRLAKIRDDHFDKIAHLKSVIKDMEAAKREGKNIELEMHRAPFKKQKPPMQSAKAKSDEK